MISSGHRLTGFFQNYEQMIMKQPGSTLARNTKFVFKIKNLKSSFSIIRVGKKNEKPKNRRVREKKTRNHLRGGEIVLSALARHTRLGLWRIQISGTSGFYG